MDLWSPPPWLPVLLPSPLRSSHSSGSSTATPSQRQWLKWEARAPSALRPGHWKSSTPPAAMQAVNRKSKRVIANILQKKQKTDAFFCLCFCFSSSVVSIISPSCPLRCQRSREPFLSVRTLTVLMKLLCYSDHRVDCASVVVFAAYFTGCCSRYLRKAMHLAVPHPQRDGDVLHAFLRV